MYATSTWPGGLGAWRRLLLAALCVIVPTAPVGAQAQYSQPLFLELVRDPGRADVPRSAKSLALAGVAVTSGSADDAVASPGSLMLGSGTDLVASYGWFSYARNELANTPNQLPPFDPTRQISTASTTPVGYVAVATRGPRWAAAGFYDATARQSHAFATAKSTLFSTSLFPTTLIENGTGAASISQSAVRVGGSFAAGSRRARAGVGVSLYMVRLNYVAEATDTIEVGSSSFLNPIITTVCCIVDRDRVEIHEWAPGMAVSGVIAPVRYLTLAARWRREPTFQAVRELSLSVPQPPGTRESRIDHNVEFRLPAGYGVSAIATAGATTILADLSREMYAGAFSPVMSATFDPNYICGNVVPAGCEGWNFPYHDTADTTTVKVGFEQTFPAGRGRFALRGGVAFEPAYTLARLATDPSTRRTLSLPAPPIVTEFEPPRESSTWLSTGASYAWSAAEIGVGVGHAHEQTRLLIDVRLRSR
jgi:hypothetical protein